MSTIAATPVGVLKKDFESVPAAGAACVCANARGAGARVASRAAVVAASREVPARGVEGLPSAAKAGGAESVIPTTRARTPATGLAHDVNLRLTDTSCLPRDNGVERLKNPGWLWPTGSNPHANFLNLAFEWQCLTSK